MNTIGVILAGGASSRMGQDKALLTISQSTMLTRTYQLLLEASVSKVVISRNDGEAGHFSDLYPGKGPLSGIHSAAMRFPDKNLLILPIDLPLMDVCTIQRLLDSGEKFSSNVRFGEHSLPLYLRNTETTRQTLDYTLRCTNSFSVDRFCTHFPLMKLQLRQQSPLFNSNTPEQWRFAMQHFETSECSVPTEVRHGTC